MKTNHLARVMIPAACALALAFGGNATASARPGPPDHYGNHGHDSRHHQGHYGASHREEHHYAYRDDRREHYDHHRAYADHAHRSYYARGDRAPYRFREPAYYVRDYRAYHLRRPPYGYRWVRDDRREEYLLIGIATGVIAAVVAEQYGY